MTGPSSFPSKLAPSSLALPKARIQPRLWALVLLGAALQGGCGGGGAPVDGGVPMDGGALVDGGAPVTDGGVTACAAYAPPVLAGPIDAPGLTELSGLAASRTRPGLLYAHNDSGNAPELFVLGTDGGLIGVFGIDGARNVDWEDIAVGPCAPGEAASCVFIGDIGDNGAVRSTGIRILVVAEPARARPSSAPLPLLRTHFLRYPDGPRDAEALLVHPQSGDLYIVEKRPRPDGGAARGVYKARAGDVGTENAPVTMELVAFLEVPSNSDGLFTAGDIHPSGRRVALRTYTALVEYRLPEGRPFDEIFQQAPVRLPRAEGSGGLEAQGEALAYGADGRSIYTSSEGSAPPLNRWDCAP